MLREYSYHSKKKKIQKFCIIAGCTAIAVLGAFFVIPKFFNHSDPISFAACIPSDKSIVNTGTDFTLGADGKTIEKISVYRGFDKAMLEKAAEEEGDAGNDIPRYFRLALLAYTAEYTDILEGNEIISWIKPAIEVNEGKMKFKYQFTFDLTNPDFVPNEETQEFMAYFGLDSFFDEKSKTYVWSDAREEDFLSKQDTQLSCSHEN